MIPPRIGIGCAGLVMVWGLGAFLMLTLAVADDCLGPDRGACSGRAHFMPVLMVGLIVLALTAALLWWINRPPDDPA